MVKFLDAQPDSAENLDVEVMAKVTTYTMKEECEILKTALTCMEPLARMTRHKSRSHENHVKTFRDARPLRLKKERRFFRMVAELAQLRCLSTLPKPSCFP